MKIVLLRLASFIGFFWCLIPQWLRQYFITGLFIIESRSSPKKGLVNLFKIKDFLELVINERAIAYGSGVHPKHRLTEYHKFFINNITNKSRVIDIGCGYGAVAYGIANHYPECQVMGVDLNEERLLLAKKIHILPNLSFKKMDATASLPDGKWDVIVLSNVLEHISSRVDFLKKIALLSGAGLILIRVPIFERDWEIPMRRELGINYYSDRDHKIEHKLSEFLCEIKSADLIIGSIQTLWGEIWAKCYIKN